MRRTARLPLPLLLITLVLAGCTQPDPMPSPPPTPSSAPVFASDEEALAAAEEAYGKYLETVAAILSEGGQRPERLKPLVTDDIYARDFPGYEQYAEREWRGVGNVSFTITAQDLDLITGTLSTYVCEDRSGFDVIDANGDSVVPVTRVDKTALEVRFVWQKRLVIAAQEGWEGGGVCD